MASQHRRVRHADGVQPLRRRLGARDGHAVPVDEAGRLALGRHAQRHDRALAERHRRRKGEVRNQFHHVIDVAPTVLEAAGLPEPTHRPRRRRRSRSRASACATRSTTPRAAERHETQYFEMFCNRGIYHQGWTAVTRHRRRGWSTPSCRRSTTTCGSSTTRTPTGRQAHDLAAEQPGEARRAAGAVHRGGAQVQRAAARRPPGRALQLRHRRPAAAHHAATRSCCSAAWGG